MFLRNICRSQFVGLKGSDLETEIVERREAMLDHETLTISRSGRVGVVTFNRPKVLNAFDTRMCMEIISVCNEISSDDSIHVVIFTGSGHAFVAGADISAMQPMTPAGALEFLKKVIAATKAIENLEIPTIAAINGFAFGGGNELAMSFDIRIASEEAKFGQQEVNYGIAPGGGATQRLARLVGYGRAMEMILTGEPIDAQEAYRIGLVNKVVSANSLMDECLRIANRLSQKSKAALAQAKSAVKASRSLDMDRGLEFEIQCSALLWSTQEQKQLMKAFLDKQKKE
jgi:enoyl-CoA hydratase